MPDPAPPPPLTLTQFREQRKKGKKTLFEIDPALKEWNDSLLINQILWIVNIFKRKKGPK